MTTQSILGPGVERRSSVDRRRRRSGIHVPERRLGFDRRTDPSAGPRRVAYLRAIRRISESRARAAVLMAAIVVLNVADIAFTFRALGRGLEEVNPVMASLLDAGHGIAAFVKVGAMTVIAGLGWWLRRFRRVIEGAILIVGLMSLVALYHVLTWSVA